MVRLFNAYFPGRTLILSVSEMLLVGLAFLAPMSAFYGRDVELVMRYEGGIAKVALVSTVFFGCMYYLDMYDSFVLSNRREIVTRLILVAGISSIILAAVYYVVPDIRMGLVVFVSGVVLFLLAVSFWRELFFGACRALHLVHRTLVLGEGGLAFELAGEVQKRPEAAIELLGYVNSSGIPNGNHSLHFLGAADSLPDLVRRHKIERIVIAMQDQRGKMPIEQLLALKAEGVQVQDGADLYEALTGKVALGSLRLSSLLFSSGFCVSPVLQIYKRVVSLLFSAVSLAVCAPVMLLATVAIRLSSRGAVIYRQKRVGHKGKVFTLYKFRTMYEGADSECNHRPAEANDSRVTRVGYWLRRSRIDELPQLYNILKGDMSFVGPRPFVPDQEAECLQHIPFYSQRWAVRPGATGWAQVQRGYCASIDDNADKLAYDLFYIKNMSVGLDLLILFQTVKTLLLGRGGR